MQVYIEYAVLDNLIVDFFLLRQAAVLLRIKYKKRFLLLASVIGTMIAVVLPVANLPAVVSFIIKILSGLLITLIAVKHLNMACYLKYFNVFLLLTFLLGGIIIGIMSLLGIPYDFEAYYSNKLLPVGLNVLCGYLVVFGVKKFVKRFVSSVTIAPDLYSVQIVINGDRFPATAFFDNGNRLFDERKGLPIIVCCERFFKKISAKTPLNTAGRLLFTTAAGVSENEYYDIDYIIVSRGKEGELKHACIMKGEVRAVDADMIIGRALL